MTDLVELLFTICTALLIPVILVLLVFLASIAVFLGGFLRECLSRRAGRQALDACLSAAKLEPPPDQLLELLRKVPSGMGAAFYGRIDVSKHSADTLAHIVLELEHDISASMAKLSLLTRIGPMLGLMGTLIPLGPALAGLAAGDMRTMAQNLIEAFTTTVLGVLIGSIAYGISLTRRAWYARDLSDLEFICQRLASKEKAA